MPGWTTNGRGVWPISRRHPHLRRALVAGRLEQLTKYRLRRIVDDEASIRDLLAKVLKDYDVDVVPDGRSAIELLRLYPYNLLIVDLKMPGMDGLSVIREGKRLKADLRVIIITGYSTEASAIEAINLGVQGYLTKPFRVPRVLNAAAKALGETAS